LLKHVREYAGTAPLTTNQLLRIGPLNAFWRVWRFRELRWGGKLVGTDQFGNKYYEQLEAIPSMALCIGAPTTSRGCCIQIIVWCWMVTEFLQLASGGSSMEPRIMTLARHAPPGLLFAPPHFSYQVFL
jgi:hypothetical protein